MRNRQVIRAKDGSTIQNVIQAVIHVSPLAWVLGAIILGISLIVIAIIVRYDNNKNKMTGEFNIAVAEFSLQQDLISKDNPDAGYVVASQIYQRLNSEIETQTNKPDVIFQLWPPEKVGAVTGKTAQERGIVAERIAKQIGADIIIYGIIKGNSKSISVIPEIYVSGDFFSVIPEFIGEHPLGNEIDIGFDPSDLAGRVRGNKTISSRVNGLALIALGLSYYKLTDYQYAYNNFRSASDIHGWGDEPGKESLYLMLAFSGGKLDRVDEAIQYLNQALLLNPDYARAYNGLGEMYLRRSLGIPLVDSFSKVSLVDLTLAEANYLKAIDAKDQPETADIKPKVSFGMGKSCLIRFQISNDPTYLEKSRAFFRDVISVSDSGNTRISEITSLSHGYLGTIAFYQQDFKKAEAEYKTAIGTVISPRAKAGFWAQLGDLYTAQNMLNPAIEAYNNAAQLAPDEASRMSYQKIIDQLRKTIIPTEAKQP